MSILSSSSPGAAASTPVQTRRHVTTCRQAVIHTWHEVGRAAARNSVPYSFKTRVLTRCVEISEEPANNENVTSPDPILPASGEWTG